MDGYQREGSEYLTLNIREKFPNGGKIVIFVGIGTISQELDEKGVKHPKAEVGQELVNAAKKSLQAEGIDLEGNGIVLEIREIKPTDSTNVVGSSQEELPFVASSQKNISTATPTQEEIALAIHNASLEEDVIAVIAEFGTSTNKEFTPKARVMITSKKPVFIVTCNKAYNERGTDAYRAMRNAIVAAYEFARRGIGQVYSVYDREIADARFISEHRGRPDYIFGPVASFDGDSNLMRFRNTEEDICRRMTADMDYFNLELSKNVLPFLIINGVDIVTMKKNLKQTAELADAILLINTHDCSVRGDMYQVIAEIAEDKPMAITPLYPVIKPDIDYETARALAKIGVLTGTGWSIGLDHALLEAATARGTSLAERKIWFRDFRTRAEVGKFHGLIIPEELISAKKLLYNSSMSYPDAVDRTLEMNSRFGEWVRTRDALTAIIRPESAVVTSSPIVRQQPRERTRA
jgi:hypothetical protein